MDMASMATKHRLPKIRGSHVVRLVYQLIFIKFWQQACIPYLLFGNRTYVNHPKLVSEKHTLCPRLFS